MRKSPFFYNLFPVPFVIFLIVYVLSLVTSMDYILHRKNVSLKLFNLCIFFFPFFQVDNLWDSLIDWDDIFFAVKRFIWLIVIWEVVKVIYSNGPDWFAPPVRSEYLSSLFYVDFPHHRFLFFDQEKDTGRIVFSNTCYSGHLPSLRVLL